MKKEKFKDKDIDLQEIMEEFDIIFEDADIDDPMCCDDRYCSCKGETIRDSIKDFIRLAIKHYHEKDDDFEIPQMKGTREALDNVKPRKSIKLK